MPITRRVVMGLSALALVGITAGAACSHSGDKPATVVQEAPLHTIAAGTANVAFSVATPSGEARTKALTINGDGAFDFKAKKGRLAFDVPTTTPPAKVETVIVGSDVYAKLPKDLLPLAGGAKPWIKLGAAAAASRAGLGVRGLESADLNQALQYLQGATGSMTRVGIESVRGKKVTHYRGPLDLERAAARVKAPYKEATRRLIDTIGSKTIPSDVWVDSDRRVTKLVLAPPQVTLAMELFDFGTTVSVNPPPADQVTDLTALLGR